MRRLPTATGKWLPSISHRAKMAVPSRPTKPTALEEMQNRVARLRAPRRPFLNRVELHDGHYHPVTDKAIIDLTEQYVTMGNDLAIQLLNPSPWQRHQVAAQLGYLEAVVPEYKMAAHMRIGDIRHQLRTTP